MMEVFMAISRPLERHAQTNLDGQMPSGLVDLGAIADETDTNEELVRQIAKTDGCTRARARIQIKAFKKAFENL
jgi:hypothetical protein